MNRRNPATIALTDDEIALIDEAAAYEGSSRADILRRGGLGIARRVMREAAQEAAEPAKNGGRRS